MGGYKRRGSRPITSSEKMYLNAREKRGSSSDRRGNSTQPASPNYSSDTYQPVYDNGGDAEDVERMLMSVSHTAQ